MRMTTCMRCVPLDRCYCRTPAAELPEGSVVADERNAMVKTGVSWLTTDLRVRVVGSGEVDRLLAEGARLLRVGNGEEG